MIAHIYRSSKDYRLHKKILFSKKEASYPTINVNQSVKRQQIKGFGGAFTESSAHVYYTLNRMNQLLVMKILFSRRGLHYNLGRTTVGSCDFSIAPYDYAREDDLSDFTLVHDRMEIIPFIKEANKVTNLTLLASCWSPLAKYKSNQDKCHGGTLLPEYYDMAAKYLALYVENMKKEGLTIYALTVQNEPEATQTWESCLFTPEEEYQYATIVKKYLPECDIYGYDHNRDHLMNWANTLYSLDKDKKVFKGLAYHWYEGYQNDQIKLVKDTYPDRDLIFSEGCLELLNLNREDPTSAIGNYDGAIRYFKNYLLDSNNGATAFFDWNLLLDEKGGPNHVGNYCEALVMKRGKKLRVNSSFYGVYHFAHFIQKDAYNIETTSKENILSTAFLNPDNSIVVELLNEGPEKRIDVIVKDRVFNFSLRTNELATLVV